MKLSSKAFPCYSLLVVALVYLALVYDLPKNVFWISDNGNRFLQVQSIIQQHFSSIAILPTIHEESFSPLQPPHFYPDNGSVFSYYPFPFPYLSAVPATLFGNSGLFIIPVVSSLLLLVVFVAFGRKLPYFENSPLPVLILGLATPIFFYTLTFWEHTLTVLLAITAVYLVVAAGKPSPVRSLVLAGVIAGSIPWFRPEGYVFCGVLAAALFLTWRQWREVIWFAAGCLPAIALLWLLNHYVYGSLLGVHAAKYYQLGELFGNRETTLSEVVLGKAEVLYAYLLQYSDSLTIGLVCSLPFPLAMIVGGTRRQLQAKLIIPIVGAALVGSGVLMLANFRADDPVFATLTTQGLCIATPFIVFFLLGIRKNLTGPADEIRFLTLLVLGFLVIASLSITNYERGILWGPRYYLLIYPFLTILSLQTFHEMVREPLARGAKLAIHNLFYLLLAISFVIQGYGVVLLYCKTNGTERILNTLTLSPAKHIVTDVYWLPEEMAALFYRKKFLLVRSTARLNELKTLLEQEKAKTFDLVLSPRYSNRQLFSTLESMFPCTDIRSISDSRLPWMKLYLITFSMKPADAPLPHDHE